MNARQPHPSKVDAARQVLRGRATMPSQPDEWGRTWGFHPTVSARLVREVERERRTPLTSSMKGTKHG